MVLEDLFRIEVKQPQRAGLTSVTNHYQTDKYNLHMVGCICNKLMERSIFDIIRITNTSDFRDKESEIADVFETFVGSISSINREVSMEHHVFGEHTVDVQKYTISLKPLRHYDRCYIHVNFAQVAHTCDIHLWITCEVKATNGQWAEYLVKGIPLNGEHEFMQNVNQIHSFQGQMFGPRKLLTGKGNNFQVPVEKLKEVDAIIDCIMKTPFPNIFLIANTVKERQPATIRRIFPDIADLFQSVFQTKRNDRMEDQFHTVRDEIAVRLKEGPNGRKYSLRFFFTHNTHTSDINMYIVLDVRGPNGLFAEYLMRGIPLGVEGQFS